MNKIKTTTKNITNKTLKALGILVILLGALAMLYNYGVNKGIEQGRKALTEEIRIKDLEQKAQELEALKQAQVKK